MLAIRRWALAWSRRCELGVPGQGFPVTGTDRQSPLDAAVEVDPIVEQPRPLTHVQRVCTIWLAEGGEKPGSAYRQTDVKGAVQKAILA